MLNRRDDSHAKARVVIVEHQEYKSDRYERYTTTHYIIIIYLSIFLSIYISSDRIECDHPSISHCLHAPHIRDDAPIVRHHPSHRYVKTLS